jgi:hypothetical protein
MRDSAFNLYLSSGSLQALQIFERIKLKLS